MQADSQTWWTDDRIHATVTSEYILKQFKPENKDFLKRAITFGGGGLAERTYLGWILERANRFFLILVHIGIPERIFGLVDDSYEDNDLPIALEAVKDLKLSPNPNPSLDKNFYNAQFTFLVRDIKQGSHIRFLDEETIPVRLVASASGTNRTGKDGCEKVHIDKPHLASGVVKVYGRKRVVLDEPPNYLIEADILSEVSTAKRLAHQHVLSLYASYGHGNSVFILLSPAIEYTLNAFIDSPPKHFETLPKLQRREILLNWPHCLANGLAWLHSNNRHHGALRPSNIVIDNEYRIYLGQIEGLPITHGVVKSSDIESYQYAAPERWKRAATMQKKAPAMVTMHSGGRTARKANPSRHSASSSNPDIHESRGSVASPSSPGLPIDMSKPTSTAYPFIPTSKGNVPRGPSRIAEGLDYAASILSSDSSGTRQDRMKSPRMPSNQPESHFRNRKASSASAARSLGSSHSGEGGQNITASMPHSVTVAPTEIRSALVQTWQSAQFDQLAADVFSLGAIILDIFTFFCKRSSSAFARHRSAKNRTAGRGGGVADASFHANLGQVFSWSVSLEQDAKKKASREEGRIFAAVSPMVDIARECLARAAEDRPEAGVVENSLEGSIQQFTSSGTAHCSFRSHLRGGQLDAAGKSRSDLRPPPKHTTRNASPRKPPLPSLKWREEAGASGRLDAATSSLASFNFDAYSERGDYDVDESFSEKLGYSASYPDDETIDLQSIADRPDRIQNGTDISGWSHMHTDSRASYVSSSTQSPSIAEPEPIDNFFKPASQPPALPPKHFYQARPARAPSQQSVAQSQASNTARKRIRSDVARQRQKNPISEADIQLEDISGRHRVGPRSGSSTDSSQQRQSVTSSMDHSRGRLSVSTLASNSSTIRMSWQDRDVSPVSLRDPEDTTPNASASVLTSVPSDDEAEPDDHDAKEGPRSVDPEEQAQSSRQEDKSRSERVGRYFQSGSVSVVNTSGDSKGKKKAENTGSKKTWYQRRYSLLGGKN
jgi:hypothetical protein